MKTRKIYLPALLALSGILSSCGHGDDLPARSNSEISGTYDGSYAGGTEVFKIWENGTFSQTFKGGTNAGYTSTGKWVYKTNNIVKGEYRSVLKNGVYEEQKISDKTVTNQVSEIEFTPFMVPAGGFGCATNTRFDRQDVDWHRNPVRLDIGVWPYYATKVETSGQTVK